MVITTASEPARSARAAVGTMSISASSGTASAMSQASPSARRGSRSNSTTRSHARRSTRAFATAEPTWPAPTTDTVEPLIAAEYCSGGRRADARRSVLAAGGVSTGMNPQATSPDPRRWWVLALLCGAFFMVILDASIVFVALPSIGDELGFSDQGLQWVVSAYALTFGGLLLLGGRAADLLGRRRVFMVGVAVFAGASLLCGLAWSPASLLAARAIQGIGAAIMTPTALSIISTTFPEGPERNKALGIWGMLGGLGATAGWLIGGPFVDGPGWEWIFFINVPIGLAALAIAPALLHESRAALARRSYDPAGALTITGALVLLVYALVEAPDVGWGDVRTILLLAGSAALLAAFVLIESRHRAPLVPLRLFRSRTLVGANLVMLVFSTVAVGMPFVLTLYAQQVLGYSAVEFGIGSVVLALGATVGAIVAQGAGLKVGFRPVAATGMALMGAGSLLL